MNSKLEIIARIRTDFPEKFGIPRQSGVVSGLRGRIVFEPEYRNCDCIRGLEEFSHIWIIWQFSQNLDEDGKSRWSPMVRPPRLGGNRKVGVFATRSPFRPNPIGLSAVQVEMIETESAEGPVIYVKGADMVDGTPIYDIKPYIPYADAIPEANGGFVDSTEYKMLKVVWNIETSHDAQNKADIRNADDVPVDIRTNLEKILANDPRPHYHDDPERVYGMSYAGYEVKFKVVGDVLYILDIE